MADVDAYLASTPSTTTNKDFLPYWNEYTQQLSQQLSLNVVTDSVATNLSWSSGTSEKLTKETWFHVKCTKIVPTYDGCCL